MKRDERDRGQMKRDERENRSNETREIENRRNETRERIDETRRDERERDVNCAV